MIRRTVNGVTIVVPTEESNWIYVYINGKKQGGARCNSAETLEKFRQFLEGIPDADN